MPHTHKNAWYPRLLSFSNKSFFDVGDTLIMFQRESDRTIQKLDFERNFRNMSDFVSKVLQSVRFCMEKIDMFQVLILRK